MPKRQNFVWEALAQIGSQKQDLKRILLTHADMDHVGSLAVIQAETGAKVYAGRETAVLIQSGKSPQHMPWAAQWIIDRFMRYQTTPSDVIEVFTEGDVLPCLGGLQVMATPGHTLDHFSFYSPTTGVVLAGDALNTRNGRLQRTPSRITADEVAANRSAIRLIELAPAVIACGHGEPMQHHSTAELMGLFGTLRNS
jgi:glyoxylase-like metal-dependent hydrolase (beta-lactamase superfamily II)